MTLVKPLLIAAALITAPVFAETVNAPVSELSPVGILKSRTHTVEIFTSGGEPVYTVHSQGVTVAEKLSLESLRHDVPEAYDLVSAGVARDASLSRNLVVPQANSAF